MNPKISIVVPVYNVEQYLAQCIESLINQTLKEIEIILVDDGSTDNSGSICEEYANRDNRIKVIHKKNGGLSDARNTGNKFVNSSYLMYVDSDDWIDLNTCEVAYDVMLKSNADLVFWSRIKEFENYQIPVKAIYKGDIVFEGNRLKELKRRIVGLLKGELKNPLKTDAISSAYSKLYRFEIIKNNNLQFVDTKEIGSEDTLFNIYLLSYLNKAVFIDRKFNHYRKFNPNSLTKNHKSSLMPRYLNLFSYIKSFIIKNNLGPDYEEALNNRISLSTINLVLSITSPNNNISIYKKLNDIDNILNNQVYSNSYKKLEIKFLPIHWKLFFVFCRLKLTYGIYFLTLIMRNLRHN